MLEIIGAILGSSVISALATSYYTKKRNDKTERLKYITEERRKWRDDVRNKTNEIILDPSESKIEEYKAYFEVRLNPYDNEDIELINKLSKINSDTKDFTNAVSILLKHDWERVKHETTNKMKPYLLVLILLVITTFTYLFYEPVFSLLPKESHDIIKSFVNMTLFWFLLAIILLPYLFRLLKCIYKTIINKNFKWIEKLKKCIYSVLDLPYRKPL